MKYLYKGMALPGWGDVSGSVLLGWHEKVCRALLSLDSAMVTPLSIVDRGCGNGLHSQSHDRQTNCIIISRPERCNTVLHVSVIPISSLSSERDGPSPDEIGLGPAF